MSWPVHILATCRKPELLPYTLLVFQTLRVGFPTASVHVDVNKMAPAELDKVLNACESVRATTQGVDTIHHQWIEKLVHETQHPFYLCDTDVIFYDNFEWFEPQFNAAPLAGARIPEWRDEYAASITRSRLHTSLLWIDPVLVRKKLKECTDALPKDPFVPFVNPFYPLAVPFKQKRYFYDTCSLLYHTIGGTAFTESQLNTYSHLFFGTISDLVFPRLPKQEAVVMESERKRLLDNPSRGHGAWRSQLEYFNARAA